MAVRYRLPEDQRAALRDPFADVQDEGTVVAALADGTLGAPVITVGDIVSDTLLRHGIQPHVMVFDLSTQRGSLGDEVRKRLQGNSARLVTVPNPAATITQELVDAVEEAVAADAPTRILVEGEEDLATLPALLHAPLGATVIYGMPGRGLVPVSVTAEKKAVARRWLSLMKVGS